MIHNISRYIMTLALLLTAVTGAWAEQTVVMPGLMAPTDNSTTIDENTWKWVQVWTAANNLYMDFEIKDGSQFTGDFTPTCTQIINGLKAYGLDVCGENGKVSTVQLLSADGKVLKTAEINKALVYDAATRVKVAKEFFAEMTTDEDYIVRVNLGDCNIAWDAATKTGTFEMPAFDVEIAPIYAPTAQWAVVENVQQLPTAIEGIYAESTDAIVKAGTVAKIGETENVQGTLMYAVGKSATEQPALTTFSATLPTAKDITAAGDVYVWYYIKGADTPEGQDPTAENTFNDSEICAEPIKVTVLSNKFDIQFKAANANTIEAGKATVTVGGTAAEVKDGVLQGVKMGSKVTVTAKEGYKFRKAEVKKGGAVDPAKAYLKWDADQKELVATEFPAEVTMVQNADQGVTWTAGTYVVEGDVTINGGIILKGNVELIIKDGAKLTFNTIDGGGSGKNLSIYGQANQTGQLVVNNSNGDAISGITTLEVHSCQVKATSSNDYSGGFFNITTINVYGGSVDAECTSSADGYGIIMPYNGSMNIYGGDVKAVGKGTENGITGGPATVTVYGGKLWAENADNKALGATVTLTKGAGFSGKIETSGDGSSWGEYNDDATPTTKYVRVGY